MMRFLLLMSLTLAFSPLPDSLAESPKPVIFMIGDSTMANKSLANGNPERGWGQLLPEYFNADVQIENRAKDGRSTRSFIDEGLWKGTLEKMKPGDWLIIQFGHNDQKKDKPQLYAAADGDYRVFLTRFATEAKAKSVQPMIVSSIYRLRFNPEGTVKSTAGEYPAAAKALATELGLPFVDLHTASGKCLQATGEEASKSYFLHFAPGELAGYPEGKHDNTHLSELGARTMAGLFVEALREQKSPLCAYLKAP